MSSISTEKLDEKIEAIVDYLCERQLADGCFPTLRTFDGETPDYASPSEFDDWYHWGSCLWIAAVIAYHLCSVNSPKLVAVREKLSDYLEGCTEFGLARYESAHLKPRDYPADVDDSSAVCIALRRNGREAPFNEDMVVNNVGATGMIHTWIVPHWRQFKNLQNGLWVVRDFLAVHLRAARYRWNPVVTIAIAWEYWRCAEQTVVSNVLLATGINKRTRSHLERLIHNVETDNLVLQYYDSPMAIYFGIARLYEADIEEVGVLREKVVKYITKQQDDSGEVESPLLTSVAALTLIYFECWEEPALDRAIQYLASHEMHDNGWKPFHIANDTWGLFNDGGAELTATFYLEALYRYRARYGADESNEPVRG
jgi:hypothetical protein